MRLLELFSGTGSVRKAVGHLFDEIVSVDILEKFQPTECADILRWDYKKFPTGHFDVIWASPPCTEFSALLFARPDRPRNLDLADSIVKKTIEIIEYFNPDKWFIENPKTGMLKDREFMLGVPFVDVDYCRYSDWGYKKQTRIWTNIDYEGKTCNGKCGNMVGKKHKKSVGNSSYKNKYGTETDYTIRLANRYRIPEKLIRELFAQD
jgi:site-specific DNA-cytosine methylase